MFLRSLILLTAVSFVASAGTIQIPWKDLCSASRGRPLVLNDRSGQKFEGYCVSITVDAVSVRTVDGGMAKVARDSLSRIALQTETGHRLRRLGSGMSQGLRYGVRSTFSPLAPIGIVTVPATLAWGAIAAPFCLLGDLASPNGDWQEIRLK